VLMERRKVLVLVLGMGLERLVVMAMMAER
jgi:hypothetical protein